MPLAIMYLISRSVLDRAALMSSRGIFMRVRSFFFLISKVWFETPGMLPMGYEARHREMVDVVPRECGASSGKISGEHV